MKRHPWIFICLCALICLAMVSACGEAPASTETHEAGTATAAPAKTTPQPTAEPEATESVPFKETLSLSWLCTFWDTGEIDKTTDVENLIMEQTNTDIDFMHVLRGEYATKASTLLASGDLPDIVTVSGFSINEWARQGAVIPVDDLLEEYGQDILAKWGDNVRMSATNVEDGKIYNILGVNDFSYGPGMMIRQDWLEELNLQTPVTVEDYIDVLTAFRDGDPNGNGQNDEIPFVRHVSLAPWFYAYGIMADSPDQISGSMTGGMYEVKDGRLVPFFLNERYQECLENLAYLYEEKLLDQEYLVRDAQSRDELIHNSVVGCAYVNGGASISTATKNIRDISAPEGTMVWLAPPQGPYGDAYVNGRSPISTGAAITVKADEPEKIMMLLNWYFTEQGIITTNFGQEGVHHEMVNGKPRLLPPYADSTFATYNRVAGMTNNINFMCWDGNAFLQCVTNGQDVSQMDELTTLSYEGYVLNAPYAFTNPSMGSISDTELNVSKAPDVWVPLFDMQNKIIMGDKTFADMEALLAELEDDIAELTDQANEYYAIMTGTK